MNHRKFQDTMSLNSWFRLDEESFACNICDKQFPSCEKLEEHEMLHDVVKYRGTTAEQGKDQVCATEWIMSPSCPEK